MTPSRSSNGIMDIACFVPKTLPTLLAVAQNRPVPVEVPLGMIGRECRISYRPEPPEVQGISASTADLSENFFLKWFQFDTFDQIRSEEHTSELQSLMLI